MTKSLQLLAFWFSLKIKVLRLRIVKETLQYAKIRDVCFQQRRYEE